MKKTNNFLHKERKDVRNYDDEKELIEYKRKQTERGKTYVLERDRSKIEGSKHLTINHGTELSR